MEYTRDSKEEETVETEDYGVFERRVETACINCPCCGKKLRLYLVDCNGGDFVYEPLPDHDPGKVYLMNEDR